MKFLAKLSVVILILGGILFGIGNAMGGTVYSSWYDGRLHPWHEAKNIGFSSYDSLRHTIHDQVHDIVYDVREGIADAMYEISPASPALSESSFSSNNVKNLEFNLGCGTYTIKRGAEFSTSGTGLEHIKAGIDADTWYVSYNDYNDSHHSQKCHHDAEMAQRAVTITIPEGMTFQEVELNAGVSSVALCALTADEISFAVGAGQLSTAPLTANSLNVEVGMGTAAIQLADHWENYHYELESGLGSITVNGDPLVNEFAGESSGGQGARALDFTVGMGKIQVTTKQNEG